MQSLDVLIQLLNLMVALANLSVFILAFVRVRLDILSVGTLLQIELANSHLVLAEPILHLPDLLVSLQQFFVFTSVFLDFLVKFFCDFRAHLLVVVDFDVARLDFLLRLLQLLSHARHLLLMGGSQLAHLLFLVLLVACARQIK